MQHILIDILQVVKHSMISLAGLVVHVPVDMTFMARPDDTLGPGASGQIEAVPGTARAWRFVAEQPGRYTFVASSGGAVAAVRSRTRTSPRSSSRRLAQ